MSEKDKMSRMEALLNKRLSAIESKLDDLQSTSDSRTARLSDKVSSLQATVDYMTTLIEQLSEKAQFRQNDEKFEPVQIEAFEDQLLPAKDDEIAHDMIEENASLIDPNPETRSMDSTNSFAIIPTGMATNEALKRGSRTISETSSFAEIEDDISESGTLIEDADEVVEKEEHHANASNDDQVERNEDVSPQNNEPRENDELQAKENGEDCLSIEYAKQRESIKKIQDRIFEESKSSASSTSSPTVSRQSSESSSTASRWSESTREQHNAMVEKQLRELRGELSDASIIAHSVGDGFTPMNSTNSVPSTRSSLTDSINLDVRVDPFLTNDNIIPAPPRTSPSASLNARQQEESRTQDLASRMASAAPFEPRFQIPLSAMETDPNRNQMALSRAFEQNHSFATVVNQAADSTSHPRISNAEAVAAVNALKREFGEEHEPLIVAAMKKFSGNANQCKAFLNSRQLTTQFLIAKFRLEDLDCQVDLETLAQLTVTYDNISQVVNDYIEFEFQQQAMAPEAPRRRGAEHDHHLFGVDRLIQFVSQKANEISSIISH